MEEGGEREKRWRGGRGEVKWRGGGEREGERG